MSLFSFSKPSFNARPTSAKPSSSPIRPKTQSSSSDLFAEFENFRSQVKKEYNDKLLQGRASTLQDDILRLKASNSTSAFSRVSNVKSGIYSTLPVKSTNKENIEKSSSFIDSSATKRSIPQIESLKKTLKELSAKKPEKSKESLLSSLQFGRENQSFRATATGDSKHPADLRSLLSSFEKDPRIKSSENGTYRFGTSGALSELENRAKLMIPSPGKKTKADALLSSFELSNRKKLEFTEQKNFTGKWEEKKLLMKVTELQESIIDLNDQDFNEYSSQ